MIKSKQITLKINHVVCTRLLNNKSSKRFFSTPSNDIVKITSPQSIYVKSTSHELEHIRDKKGFILDMDGVIYYGNKPLQGVKTFLEWMLENQKQYLFLTNSSERTPVALSEKVKNITGLSFPPDRFHTCALSTAKFVASQTPGGTAYVIGEHGLIQALVSHGYTVFNSAETPQLTHEVDYVIVGDTTSYNYLQIHHAVELVLKGAKLIGTNKDIRDRMGNSFVPSTGALISPIELTTNRKPYFLGKPNPFIMRDALLKFPTLSPSQIAIVGDNMDTDIIGGIESGIDTVLVLSGVTSFNDLPKWSYRPHFIIDKLVSIIHETKEKE